MRETKKMKDEEIMYSLRKIYPKSHMVDIYT